MHLHYILVIFELKTYVHKTLHHALNITHINNFASWLSFKKILQEL